MDWSDSNQVNKFFAIVTAVSIAILIGFMAVQEYVYLRDRVVECSVSDFKRAYQVNNLEIRIRELEFELHELREKVAKR